VLFQCSGYFHLRIFEFRCRRILKRVGRERRWRLLDHIRWNPLLQELLDLHRSDGILSVHEFTERSDHLSDLGFAQVFTAGDEDPIMYGGPGAFFLGQQLLIQLLARSRAAELDRDLLLREAGQTDQIPRQIDDLHRFAHVKDEDLAAFGQRASLDDELHRLGDRHEVPRHLRMRHRDRAASLDLLAEQRDDASPAAQHVAESNRRERGPADRVLALHDHLGRALACPHHIGRVDRLVRRDHDEAFDFVLVRQFDEIPGAQYVVLHRFDGLKLHERHMLVGSGMEDNMRAIRLEQMPEASGVLDIRDDRMQMDIQIPELAAELGLDLIDAVLAATDQYQCVRLEIHDLAAQLRADRASRTGHHHDSALQIISNGRQIDAHRIPSQQILQFDIAQTADREPSVHQVVDARDDLDHPIGRLADIDDLRDLASVHRWKGEDDLLDIVLVHDLRDIIAVPDDRDARQIQILLVQVVVDEGDRVILRTVTLQLPRDDEPRFPGADDEHPPPLVLALHISVTHQSPDESRSGDAQEGEGRCHQQDTARYNEPLRQHIADQRCDPDHKRTLRDAAGDGEHIAHAGIGPDPSIDAIGNQPWHHEQTVDD